MAIMVRLLNETEQVFSEGEDVNDLVDTLDHSTCEAAYIINEGQVVFRYTQEGSTLEVPEILSSLSLA